VALPEQRPTARVFLLAQAVERVLADRLQHAEPRLPGVAERGVFLRPQQALLDEGLEPVQQVEPDVLRRVRGAAGGGAADGRGRLEGAPVGEDREAVEQVALISREEVVAAPRCCLSDSPNG
jgi:hypothetical protein